MITHEWAIDGESFYFTPDSDIFFKDSALVGMGMPEHFSFTRDAALQDGQTFNGWKMQPREVLWPVVIAGGDYWLSVQRAFWSKMRPSKYGVWRVTDSFGDYRELTIRYLTDGGGAYTRDPSVQGIEVHAISMIADDPWWHGAPVSVTMQTAQDEQPFYETAPTHVLNIMSSNTVATPALQNPGDAPAWYTIRVDGPSTGFSFGDGTFGVAGNINVSTGEWLIVDTNPTEQTALLFTAPTVFTDVTDQLTQMNPRPVAEGDTGNYSVVLNGAGSMTVSLVPRYFRAF